MSEKICGIYKITSPSGKIYIGQSNDIYGRWNGYRRLQLKYQKRLLYSFNKHGVENHTFEIIHKCSELELDKFEIHYINLYDTFQTEHGLNLKHGGSFGTHSLETKRKISEAGKLRKPNPEAWKKISIAKKGVPMSDEHKRKMGLSKIGNKYSLGRVTSDETKLKISNSLKGHTPWNKGKRGIYSKETRERISKGNMGKSHLVSKEARMKISLAHKGNKYNVGRKYSEETKNKIAESLRIYHKKRINDRLENIQL